MLVRRCGLTRPDDLVGLRGVEHVQFPRRHEPFEARIRRPFDRRHRPLRPAPDTPCSSAERYRPHRIRQTPPPSQPWAILESAGTSFLIYPWRVLGLPWLHPFDRRLMRTGPRATPGRFRTRVITEGVTPSLHVDYKHTTIKQYHKLRHEVARCERTRSQEGRLMSVA